MGKAVEKIKVINVFDSKKAIEIEALIATEDDAVIVKFPYNPGYIAKIKSVKGYRWHPDGKYWSIPYSELESLLAVFVDERIEIDPSIWLYELREELAARKYSRRTAKLYMHYNEEFLRFAGKAPYEVSNENVRDYLCYLAEKKNCSASTLNVAINALKFCYGEVLKRRFVYEIKRPKKDKKLPVVLSQKEVSRIFAIVSNIKHKLILMLMYSAGLRVSEVVNLKPQDIDIQRKLIHIKGAKGRKDRYTILSDVAMETLGLYMGANNHKK